MSQNQETPNVEPSKTPNVETPVEKPQPKRRGRPRKQPQEKTPNVEPAKEASNVETSPTPQPKPKRKCTPKQLAALAAGRAKNKHFHPKAKDEEAN